MLPRGERDSWSGGSACMAVIYILGAIIGTTVAVSTAGACEPAGFPVAIDVGHDRDRPGCAAVELPPDARIRLNRSLSSILTKSGRRWCGSRRFR
jgi:hypothetical protein